MKNFIHSKIVCMILAISMLILGMYCGESLPTSSSLCGENAPVSSILRASDGQLNSHIYKEENRLTGLGEFMLARQNPRTVTVIRLNPLFMMLFLTGALGLIAIFFTILFLQGSCQNQYRLRTLQYIHHKDGKKQNS